MFPQVLQWTSVIDAKVAVLKAYALVPEVVGTESGSDPRASTGGTKDVGGGTGGSRGYHVDITWGDTIKSSSLATASFIKSMQEHHPALRPLVLTLKKMLSADRLNDPFYGGLVCWPI